MFTIQPTGWRGYFSLSRTTNPPWLSTYFYLSWEDALWDVLKHFQPRPGSIALLPDFFCTDVIKNMQSHGLDCKFYPVEPDLQTTAHAFVTLLTETQPDLVVLLHPAGITNTLFEHANTWLPALPKNCLLIEDCVHRVVNPDEIVLLTPRHIVLDSLRKVVPLQGSRLFGSAELQSLQQTAGHKTIRYQLSVTFWWFLMQLCLLTSTFSQRLRYKVWWNMMAEKYMVIGYDLVGDSYAAGKGWDIFERLAHHIDHRRIHMCKKRQVQLYKKLLASFWNNQNFYPIPFNEDDYGRLRGFPIGVRIEHAEQILATWRGAGILLRYELDDCVWSQKQKVVYLPLGPHVADQQIITLVTDITTQQTPIVN